MRHGSAIVIGSWSNCNKVTCIYCTFASAISPVRYTSTAQGVVHVNGSNSILDPPTSNVSYSTHDNTSKLDIAFLTHLSSRTLIDTRNHDSPTKQIFPSHDPKVTCTGAPTINPKSIQIRTLRPRDERHESGHRRCADISFPSLVLLNGVVAGATLAVTFVPTLAPAPPFVPGKGDEAEADTDVDVDDACSSTGGRRSLSISDLRLRDDPGKSFNPPKMSEEEEGRRRDHTYASSNDLMAFLIPSAPSASVP